MNPSKINGAGISGLAAIAICGETAVGITAAGTTSADAVVLTVENNFIGTAAAGTGARLSVGEISQKSWVYNGGANSVLVYPPTGGTINGGSVDAGLSLDANKAMAISYASALTVTAIADDITPALITVNAIAAGDSSLGIDGQAAAQGGAIVATGGASSTATNAGGAVTLKGGTGNTSGAGGAANVLGGVGGATGVGGQVNITGGVPIAAAGGAVVIAGAAGVGTNKAGGLASVTGGASTGSATGGVASLVGGAASAATGVGGGVAVTGGEGNTTGAGGAIVVAGGAGGSDAVGGDATFKAGAAGGGNRAGGAVVVTGGAGAGTGAGGAITLTGGASTAGGATGKGGAVNIAGGAAATTDDDGGSISLTGGAKNGAGSPGIIRHSGVVTISQAAPGTFTTTATLTAAQIIGGILAATHPGGGADVDIVLPAGSVLSAGLPASMADDDSFELVIINIGTAAAADTYTLIAGSQFTIVGNPIIQSNHSSIAATNTGRFRIRKTTADTYVAYRVA